VGKRGQLNSPWGWGLWEKTQEGKKKKSGTKGRVKIDRTRRVEGKKEWKRPQEGGESPPEVYTKGGGGTKSKERNLCAGRIPT